MYQYQNDWDEGEWDGLGIRDDLISRRAMYIALYELGGCDAAEEYDKGYDSGIGSAISALQCAPTAAMEDELQMEMNWIPCGERLPETEGLYLTTNVYSPSVIHVLVRQYDAIQECWMAAQNVEITAWMPLPAPYKSPELDGRE